MKTGEILAGIFALLFVILAFYIFIDQARNPKPSKF